MYWNHGLSPYSDKSCLRNIRDKLRHLLAMALTLNGFGVTYYGKSDVWPDGTYVKTKWIVVLFIPIIPLGSYRVVSEWGISTSKQYQLVSVPLHWRQVLTAYAVAAAVLLGIPALGNWLIGR